MIDDEAHGSDVTMDDLLSRARTITGQELRTLGMSHFAYCRSVTQDGASMVAIHAADGTPMAVVDDEESAVQAIVDHELTPALLH